MWQQRIVVNTFHFFYFYTKIWSAKRYSFERPENFKYATLNCGLNERQQQQVLIEN